MLEQLEGWSLEPDQQRQEQEVVEQESGLAEAWYSYSGTSLLLPHSQEQQFQHQVSPWQHFQLQISQLQTS